MPNFAERCPSDTLPAVVTRQQYQEHGPSVVRHNMVYREW